MNEQHDVTTVHVYSRLSQLRLAQVPRFPSAKSKSPVKIDQRHHRIYKPEIQPRRSVTVSRNEPSNCCILSTVTTVQGYFAERLRFPTKTRENGQPTELQTRT